MAGEYIINFADPGKSTFTVYPHETNGPGNVSTPRPITGVDTGLEEFEILGDFTYRFVNGFTFNVQNSTGNNGTWTVAVAGSTYSVGTNTTTIPVVENITDATVDGEIVYSAEASTSLSLTGRGSLNYGEKIHENFIDLLDNFSYTVAPSNPTRGQLWHDSTTGTLKVYNGATWDDSTVVEPVNQIVYGTGTGVTSSNTFTFDPTVGSLTFNPGTLASTGATIIRAAYGTGTVGAALNMYAGNSDSNAGGNLNLTAGDSTNAAGGSVTISAGYPATTGNGGGVNVFAADGAGNGPGGVLNLYGGWGAGTGAGGNIVIVPGGGGGTGTGGNLIMQAGTSFASTGGYLSIYSGLGATGPQAGDIDVGTGPTNRLYIKGDTGNMLIGTATDDTVNKLQVNGQITVDADPTTALQVATKQYVDAGRNPGYEYFSATAAQTVFTLTNFTYTPGSNRLMIFVNGVKQVNPANGNYVETNSTTVTFSPGLTLNDQVEMYLLY